MVDTLNGMFNTDMTGDDVVALGKKFFSWSGILTNRPVVAKPGTSCPGS